MHRLISNDVEGAFADLDSATALAPASPEEEFNQSLALNGKLIRAMALQLTGRDSEAAAMANQAVAQRPYSRRVMLAAIIVAGPDATHARLSPLIGQLARLDPSWASIQAAYLAGSRPPQRNLRAFFMLMLEAEASNRVSHGADAPSNSQVIECFDIQHHRADARLFGVCAVNENDSPASTEERALLNAAQQTLALHSARFTIERRDDTAIT